MKWEVIVGKNREDVQFLNILMNFSSSYCIKAPATASLPYMDRVNKKG
jgi:hypothetical protein